jgi:hypothetical protein
MPEHGRNWSRLVDMAHAGYLDDPYAVELAARVMS